MGDSIDTPLKQASNIINVEVREESKGESMLKNMQRNAINENDGGNRENETADIVYICAERLRKLELLESKLPNMIEDAITEHKRNKLRMLHEKDKQNPEAVNIRVKRYNQKHKAELNAKRREKRRVEKEKKIKKEPEPQSVVESFINTPAILFIQNKINNEKKERSGKSPVPLPTIEEVLTVRF